MPWAICRAGNGGRCQHHHCPRDQKSSRSNSPRGRHPVGSATQRLMSDSCHPAPLAPILSWGGNVPSAILRQMVDRDRRSEEHTSELQSLMRISYAGFCMKKKINTHNDYSLRITSSQSISEHWSRDREEIEQ